MRSSGGGRDRALDLIRGGCIVSMCFAHLATYTWPSQVLHLPRWFDGASGFVLISGLVLGMVQHSRLARGGQAGAQSALARRAVLLYAAHVAIVGLALTLGAVTDVTAPWLPDPGDVNLWRVPLLGVNLPYLDILSLYVVLLLFGMAALALLTRGRVKTLAAASGCVYLAGLLFPGVTTLAGAQFNWATWQALFLSGFVAGFHWRGRNLAARVTSRSALLAAGGMVAVIYAVCVPVLYLGVAPRLEGLAAGFVAKGSAGPGWILLAWAGFVLPYGLLARAGYPGWLGWLGTIGRRSLDSYIVLSLLVVTVPALAGRVVGGGAAVGLAVAALAAMWAWARVRDLRQSSSSLSAPATPVRSAATSARRSRRATR